VTSPAWSVVRRGFRPRPWQAMVAAVVVLAGGALLWWQQANAPPRPGDRGSVVVTIPEGATATAVANLLAARHVIRSPAAFLLEARWQGLDTRLRAGPYRFSPGWGLARVMRQLADGNLLLIRVVIPEGFTVRQIVARLVAAHLGSRRQFMAAVEKGLPGLPTPPGVRDPAEGFLFPATYLVPYGTPPAAIINMMWETFRQRTARLARRLPRGESLWQWVTLASLVQAEDERPADAPDIAAVFVNRLARGMPLQSDATVRYALGRTVPGRLTLADLAVLSPYNTYLHPGLPPGPIDCPGLMALQAALHPAAVPYLYFVGTPNGGDLFATTYAQHLSNVAKAEGMTGGGKS
jgi:UPF0755 protein